MKATVCCVLVHGIDVDQDQVRTRRSSDSTASGRWEVSTGSSCKIIISMFSQLCTCSFKEQGSTFGLSMTRAPLHLHHNNVRLPARTGTHQTGHVSSLPSGKSMSLVSARVIATHIGQPRGRDHSVKLQRAKKSTTPLPLSSLI